MKQERVDINIVRHMMFGDRETCSHFSEDEKHSFLFSSKRERVRTLANKLNKSQAWVKRVIADEEKKQGERERLSERVKHLSIERRLAGYKKSKVELRIGRNLTGEILFSRVSAVILGRREEITSRSRKYGDHAAVFNYLVVPLQYSSNCIKDIAGVITVIGPDKTAYWLESSRGYSRKLVRGFVFRDGARRLVHVKSKRDRRSALKHYVKKTAEKRKILSGLETIKRRDVQDLPIRWVQISDSLRSGNCRVGTDLFVKRHGLEDIGAIRSDWLFELEDSRYTRAAYVASEMFV